jgi:hypothetical protein
MLRVIVDRRLRQEVIMTLSLQRPSKTKTHRAAHAKLGRANLTAHPSPKNRKAMKLLADWASTPDDLGTDWWAQFEHELAATRFSIRAE